PCTSLLFRFSPRLPPRSTLFPYTTLFRSQRDHAAVVEQQRGATLGGGRRDLVGLRRRVAVERLAQRLEQPFRGVEHQVGSVGRRSEEHTSELQSRFDLVCRLLLEKKKTAT